VKLLIIEEYTNFSTASTIAKELAIRFNESTSTKSSVNGWVVLAPQKVKDILDREVTNIVKSEKEMDDATKDIVKLVDTNNGDFEALEGTDSCIVITDTNELIFGRYQPIGTYGEIIRDTVTGLEWQRCSVGQTWNTVTQHCERNGTETRYMRFLATRLTAPGGFRLPTLEELMTLVYCSSGTPISIGMTKFGHCAGDCQRSTIVQEAFPDTEATSFLTSSKAADFSTDAVCCVSFDDGRCFWGNVYDKYAVRLVRSGQ